MYLTSKQNVDLLQEVKSSEFLQVETSDYNTKFLIYRASRAHSGIYTITAKNSQGEDKAEVEVCVHGTSLHTEMSPISSSNTL